MKIKIPKFLKAIEVAKRKRNQKKITHKIGFEYKDRKKVW